MSHKSGKLGTYRALVIGINNYQDKKIPALKTAVNDAREFANLLQTRYGFKVDLLLDRQATRQAIMDKMRDLAANTSPDDSVLIYYAGHGEIDRVLNDGWWVPADATGGNSATYLDNMFVQRVMKGMKARHVLLVSDSCYSGTLFGEGRSLPPLIDDKYYLNLYNEKSRWGMTSGNKTPVSDSGSEGHSIFAYQLIKALKKNEKPYITTQELYSQIAPIIANNSEQQPLCSPVRDTGDQGGGFVFVASIASSTSYAKKAESDELAGQKEALARQKELDAEKVQLEAEQLRLEEEKASFAKKKALDEKRQQIEEERERLAAEKEEARQAAEERKQAKKTTTLAMAKRPFQSTADDKIKNKQKNGLLINKAILIGISQYSDSNINGLAYADEDVRTFYTILTNYAGYRSSDIALLLNSDATKQRIMSTITDMVRQSQKKSLDHVIFMFAEHGLPPYIKSNTSNAFLAPYDAQISGFFKESGGLVNNETFINKAWLIKQLSDLKAKEIVLILDSWYSGARNFGELLAKNAGASQTRIAVIASSNENQPSAEYSELKHGALSYCIFEYINAVRKNTNEADSSEITVTGMYTSITALFDQVKVHGASLSSRHQPVLVGIPSYDKITGMKFVSVNGNKKQKPGE